ncbi:MAG: hypothetical protein GQ574_09535 [Crocinitomix sp.]|nr:hypothetical protein [Crocinitomix sp.]
MRLFLTYLFLFCLTSSAAYAQQLSLGIVVGPNIIQQMKLDRAFYAPDNTYHTYLESNQGQGLVQKISVLNGGHVGAVLFTDYKRFGFGIEPQFHYQRTYLHFERPFQIDRIIGKKSFRMPAYFTYRLFKKPESAFVILGLNLVKEKNWDIQNPGFDYYLNGADIYSNQVEVGPDHFEGLLYDNSAYWNYMVGIGKKSGKWNSSIRFQSNLNITNHEIEAEIWQLEVSINFLFLSTKDFTEKHFLYEE